MDRKKRRNKGKKKGGGRRKRVAPKLEESSGKLLNLDTDISGKLYSYRIILPAFSGPSRQPSSICSCPCPINCEKDRLRLQVLVSSKFLTEIMLIMFAHLLSIFTDFANNFLESHSDKFRLILLVQFENCIDSEITNHQVSPYQQAYQLGFDLFVIKKNKNIDHFLQGNSQSSSLVVLVSPLPFYSRSN